MRGDDDNQHQRDRRAANVLPLSRRQLLGTAATGLALAALPGPLALADGADSKVDVLLIGGGIMSATLGVWLNELEPNWSIQMIERLDQVALESSNGWNNAGTGHSALAELNYTPEKKNGQIEIAKAVEINEAFQVTRQFLAHQVKTGVMTDPRAFINYTPHMSFVWGDDNIAYLKKRWEALKASPLFAGMEYSEDPEQLRKWVPLMMEGRDPKQKVAATWSPLGTDCEWGEVTRQYVAHLQKQPSFSLRLSTEVESITKNGDGSWRVSAKNLKDRTRRTLDAKFVFIGAGGGALHLLQKSGIPEGDDYAGFPVGGSFLINDNPDVATLHLAKAYGKASVGSPPMSVPHLDTRVLGGKRVILFGPFATFSTKFLKEGSYFDLLSSTTTSNLWPMMKVGVDEFPLVEYLAGQLMLSDDDRIAALREYFPKARKEEWRLWQAGQRVQIIKRDPNKGGVLKLGTEIVNAKDGSIAALLGASPGASTAAPIMLQVLEKVFAQKVATPEWQAKIREIVPSYGTKLNDDPDRVARAWADTSAQLRLPTPPQIDRAVLKPVTTGSTVLNSSATPVKEPVHDLAP
ncbi:malate dehydrogenase (quinone) [Methylobacterium sp. PvP062]|jgi:malate dehydrogenase (quinone)|uniref:Probable malate:quinone oxidoreductase n=1 Tax=Methylobacterium radiotolerans TaxID=31998 RepID=A0ABV2NC38_9HYPH|nr:MULTISPECIES: malate dehydrogenase (quinone) [Methylobacterium]MCX7335638.1 malate dehydrogenase (quinone) [Hyphomicrobiales bacterium]GAN46128.1 malate:quinone oxidoreductase [Methylobacterium sp. ME121]MBN6818363.1 malate dehydrogenase (quinone) [Methylobacterium organophilum]MBP2492700.1 malate dehydrogenase (quinone) [Methylobacterium sp. PvP105]MBP2500928.1 malate dehydrogenase (quinone) [Methylobacterium sp. PvP109]